MEKIYLTYFLLVIIILSYSFNPFIKQQLVSKLDSNEYTIINQNFVFILTILYFIYSSYYENLNITKAYQKLNSNDLFIGILSAIITFLGAFVFTMLIKGEEISYIMPNIQPIVILIGSVIGYYIYNERMNYIKAAGIMSIVFGSFLINYDKINS